NAVLVFVNPLYLELILLFAQFHTFKRLQLVVCHKGLLIVFQVGNVSTHRTTHKASPYVLP
ncbi:TPA: hypothetical protein ACJ3HK_002024, partial [Neisseria meningitidis]